MVTKTASRDLAVAVSDVAERERTGMIDTLNQVLANLTDLALSYKQAHWNVGGLDFYQLHLMFDEFNKQTRKLMDLVAERTVMLGGPARGTVHDAASASQLGPFPSDERDERRLLDLLVGCARTVDEHLRAAIEQTEQEQVTQDLLIDVARDIEKQRWMLQAHLR